MRHYVPKPVSGATMRECLIRYVMRERDAPQSEIRKGRDRVQLLR